MDRSEGRNAGKIDDVQQPLGKHQEGRAGKEPTEARAVVLRTTLPIDGFHVFLFWRLKHFICSYLRTTPVCGKLGTREVVE